MNKISKLYKQWKGENKGFFKHRKIKETMFKQAQYSFANYLRLKNVSISEVNVERLTFPFRWDFCLYAAPLIVSMILNFLLSFCDIPSAIAVLLCIAITVIAILTKLLSRMIKKEAKKIVLSESYFLHESLRLFEDLYCNDLQNSNVIVTMRDLALISVPMNAESVYEEKMRNSKYYYNAFLVKILESEQTFQYILYSNNNYNFIKPEHQKIFIDLCYSQIGKNWSDADVSGIVLEKLQTESKATN